MGFLSQLLPTFSNSLENPRVSLNDPRAWDELFGINLSDVGVRVTPQTAIGYSPLWRGINLISNVLMRLPFHVYKAIGHGNTKDFSGVDRWAIDPKHPAYKLIHWQVNEILSVGTWKQVMCYHALFRGNGYSAIWRNARGEPLELLPLSPTDTVPVIEDGKLLYASKVGKEKRKIPAADVYHVKGLSYNGLAGHDVLTVMKDELGLGIGARKYASKYFANGASTGGVLIIPRGMTEAAAKQLKKDWKDYQEGLDNSFRTAVLEDGAKWIPTTFDPEKSQLISARQFSVRDVANILGLPPHKLGDDSRLSYNSLEQENNATLDDSYDPWLHRFEEEADLKLLSQKERDAGSHFFGFDRRPLKRPDAKTQAEIDQIRLNSGRNTLNEVRAENNEPPVETEIGDKIRIPTTVTLGAPTPAPAPLPAATKGADTNAVNAAHRALLADRLERFSAIDADQVAKANRRSQKEGSLVDWAATWFTQQEPRVQDAIEPIFAAIFAVSNREGHSEAAKAFGRSYCDSARDVALLNPDAPAFEGLRDSMLDQVFPKQPQETTP
jgi:HK97 family phage portal protein